MPKKRSFINELSRRTFIKQAGVAAAAFTIVPRFVLGGPGYKAPSDMLYVAGIGAGGKGESDIANFAKSGKAEIAYLCDVDDRRAAKSVASFRKQNIIRTSRRCWTKSTSTLTLFLFPLPIIITRSGACRHATGQTCVCAKTIDP